ncbi:hypothetical protein F4808DRAFT_136955 [Astrocystis sublimbata]|nr:hypothetical protein F4808DRAFT_136955 [Astrocystis sublimbata]
MASTTSDHAAANPRHRPHAPAAPASISSRFAAASRLPPLSQPNTSSVSLVASTARGRPVPLSDATAADRTTALRELSRTQPVPRPSYSTKSSGPPPSAAVTIPGTIPGTVPGTTTGTYSQPVLVRTYSGPLSPSKRARSASRQNATPAGQSRPSGPPGRSRRHRQGFAVTLIPSFIGGRPSAGDDVKLPPLEAFSFKSIMAELEQDIGADLDRIADICARSRYSLSNQYEIHVAPHGSGAGFGVSASVSTDIPGPDNTGPTLQAPSIDDEHASTTQGRRRAIRRKSAAYGTLETIISSSRSSDDDRSKRRPAAEIAAQVRGRFPNSSPEGTGSADTTEAQASSENQGESTNKHSKTRSTLAAAILDHTRTQTHDRPDPPQPRTSSTNLVGEPAIPETSHNHLVSTTTGESILSEDRNIRPSAKEQTYVSVSKSVAAASITTPEEPREHSGLLGGFRFSIPWKGSFVTGPSQPEQKPRRKKSYAEGTLRQLLGITESLTTREGKPTGGRGENPE